MYSIAIGLLLACMLLYPAQSAEAALRGLTVWATAVLPTLFPYAVCCQLLASSGALERLGRPLTRPMHRLFGCPGEAGPLALLSLLGGSPIGAKLIAARSSEGALTSKQALRLACLTGTVSPMFLLGTLPAWANMPTAGWLLLGAHWAGAICTGLIFSMLVRDQRALPPQPKSSPRPQTGKTSFGETVAGSASAMLQVGGCITLGTVVAALIPSVFPHLPVTVSAGLHGILEMAGGAADISALPLTRRMMLTALSAVSSFGGLSILAQNVAFLSPVGVRTAPLLAARTLHAALSACITYLLSPLLVAQPVFSPLPDPSTVLGVLAPIVWGICLCIAAGALWLLSLANKKKKRAA